MLLASEQIRPPYPGLRPFNPDEHDLFFGRDQQIRDIVDRLGAFHFAAVIGGSGCGKSSLIYAGVIPKLRTYGIPQCGDSWIVASCTPGKNAIEKLITALNAVLTPLSGENDDKRIDNIEETLSEADGLGEFAERFRSQMPGTETQREDTNLLVFIDQFEEIFRPENQDNPEVRQLIRLIIDAYKEKPLHVFVLLTMRTEDLGKCANFLELPEVLNATSYLTRRLNEDELEQAILDPAKQGDLAPKEAGTESSSGIMELGRFDVEVMMQLYDSVAEISSNDPDHLPLLQHFLSRLWEAAQKRESSAMPSRITIADLKEATGTDGSTEQSILRRSLAKYADAIYQNLESDQHRRVAEKMFRLLADIDDSGAYKRRWTTPGEIQKVTKADPALVNKVISAFSAPHPYIRRIGEDIDVAHEALIRQWPRLKSWIDDEKGARRSLRHLLDAWEAWRSQYSSGPWPKRIVARVIGRVHSQLREEIGNRHPVNRYGPEWAQRYLKEWNKPPADYERAVKFYKRGTYINLGAWMIAVLVVVSVALFPFYQTRDRQKSLENELAQLNEHAFQSLSIASEAKAALYERYSQSLGVTHRLSLLAEASIAVRALEESAKDRDTIIQAVREFASSLQKNPIWRFASTFGWLETEAGLNQDIIKMERRYRIARYVTDRAVRKVLASLLLKAKDDKDWRVSKPPQRDRGSHTQDINPVNARTPADDKRGSTHLVSRTGCIGILHDTRDDNVILAKRSHPSSEVEKTISSQKLSPRATPFTDHRLQMLGWIDDVQNQPYVGDAQPMYNFLRLRWYEFDPRAINTKESKNGTACGKREWRVSQELIPALSYADFRQYFAADRSAMATLPLAVHWHDSITAVEDSDLVTDYFSSDVAKQKHFKITEDRKNIQYVPAGKLLLPESQKQSKRPAAAQDPIQISKISAFSYFSGHKVSGESIPNEYLAFVIHDASAQGSRDSRDSQTLVILQLDEALASDDAGFKAMQESVAQIEFQAPIVTQIAFATGADRGDLILKAGNDYYRAHWHPKALRDQACGVLSGWEQTKPDETFETKAYKTLKEDESGHINKFINNPCGEMVNAPVSLRDSSNMNNGGP